MENPAGGPPASGETFRSAFCASPLLCAVAGGIGDNWQQAGTGIAPTDTSAFGMSIPEHSLAGWGAGIGQAGIAHSELGRNAASASTTAPAHLSLCQNFRSCLSARINLKFCLDSIPSNSTCIPDGRKQGHRIGYDTLSVLTALLANTGPIRRPPKHFFLIGLYRKRRERPFPSGSFAAVPAEGSPAAAKPVPVPESKLFSFLLFAKDAPPARGMLLCIPSNRLLKKYLWTGGRSFSSDINPLLLIGLWPLRSCISTISATC